MLNNARPVVDERRSFSITELAPIAGPTTGIFFGPKTMMLSFGIPTYPGLKPGKTALVESHRHGPHTRREYLQRYIILDSMVAACDECDRLMQDPGRNPDTVYFVVSGDRNRGSYNRPVATSGGDRYTNQTRLYDLKGLFLKRRRQKPVAPSPDRLWINSVAPSLLHDDPR